MTENDHDICCVGETNPWPNSLEVLDSFLEKWPKVRLERNERIKAFLLCVGCYLLNNDGWMWKQQNAMLKFFWFWDRL
jgi:hypothetical protein